MNKKIMMIKNQSKNNQENKEWIKKERERYKYWNKKRNNWQHNWESHRTLQSQWVSLTERLTPNKESWK